MRSIYMTLVGVVFCCVVTTSGAEGDAEVCVDPQDHTNVQAQLKLAHAKLAAVQETLEVSKGEKKELQKSLDKTSFDVERFKREVEKAKVELAKLSSATTSLAQCNENTSSCEKKLTAASSAQGNAEREMTALKSQVGKLDSQLSATSSKLSSAESTLSETEAKLRLAAREKAEMEKQKGQAEKLLAAANKEAEKLKSAVKDSRKESWLFSYAQFARSGSDVWRVLSGSCRIAYERTMMLVPDHCKESTLDYYRQVQILSGVYLSQANSVLAPYYRHASAAAATTCRLYDENLSATVARARVEGLKHASAAMTHVKTHYVNRANSLVDVALEPVFGYDPSLRTLVPTTVCDRLFFLAFVIVFVSLAVRLFLAALRFVVRPVLRLILYVARQPLRLLCMCFRGRTASTKAPRSYIVKKRKEGVPPPAAPKPTNATKSQQQAPTAKQQKSPSKECANGKNK